MAQETQALQVNHPGSSGRIVVVDTDPFTSVSVKTVKTACSAVLADRHATASLP